jgi:hypothetical protein
VGPEIITSENEEVSTGTLSCANENAKERQVISSHAVKTVEGVRKHRVRLKDCAEANDEAGGGEIGITAHLLDEWTSMT